MFEFVLKLFLFILIILSPILISMLIHFLYFYFIKNMRFKEGEYQYVGYGSKLKRLIIEFPRQFILDRFNNDPDEFKDYRCAYNSWKARLWQKYYFNLFIIEISGNVS